MAKKTQDPNSADSVVQRSIEAAHKLCGNSSPQLVLQIMQEAEAQLAPTLKKARGGKGKERWTEASAKATFAQIQLTVDYTKQRLLGLTHEQAEKAITTGMKRTVRLIKTLEKHNTGIARDLDIEKAGRLTQAVNGLSSSLLMRHQNSVNRYGVNMVNEFQRVLRAGIANGATNDQMIRMLVSAGAAKGITAKSLHENEPGWFPSPTGFVARRYWAERIVRTERAYAYNQANLEAMRGELARDPLTRKKIVALIGDPRTAPDSIAVHGQIRELHESFIDGAGRVYLLPPARPNDRESVIPWNLGWNELPSTAPPPPAEVEDATQEALENVTSKHTTKSELMALVAAKKAEILEREKILKNTSPEPMAARSQAGKR